MYFLRWQLLAFLTKQNHCRKEGKWRKKKNSSKSVNWNQINHIKMNSSDFGWDSHSQEEHHECEISFGAIISIYRPETIIWFEYELYSRATEQKRKECGKREKNIHTHIQKQNKKTKPKGIKNKTLTFVYFVCTRSSVVYFTWFCDWIPYGRSIAFAYCLWLWPSLSHSHALLSVYVGFSYKRGKNFHFYSVYPNFERMNGKKIVVVVSVVVVSCRIWFFIFSFFFSICRLFFFSCVFFLVCVLFNV